MNKDKITRREFIEKTRLTVASATVLPSVLEMDQLRSQVASQRAGLENFFLRRRDEAA